MTSSAGMVRHGSVARIEQGLVLLASLLMLALLVLPIYLIPHHVPLNYNEGWNAYFAKASIRHGTLYPPAESYLTNNYPPLSFFIVGAAGILLGDDIVAGRWLALLSFAWLAVSIYQLLCWSGARRRLALLGSLLTLLALYALRPGAMAMDDPQFLAQALVTGGAVLLLRSDNGRSLPAAFASVFLIVAGGLIKHNVISLPITLCLWLLIHDRRSALKFLLALAMIGAAAVSMLYGLWGHVLFASVLGHERIVTLDVAMRRANFLAPFALPYFALAFFACLRDRKLPAAALTGYYLIIAAAVGFWMLGGEGTALNILYDAVIALGLGIVTFLRLLEDRWQGRQHAAAKLAVVEAVLLLPVIAWALFIQRGTTAQQIDLLAHEADWSRVVNEIAQSPGPAACETLSICYWAGKPPEIDFFNFGEKLRKGATTDASFRKRIAQGYYAFIEVEPSSPRLPTPTADWLSAHYAIVDAVGDQSLLLVPQGQ